MSKTNRSELRGRLPRLQTRKPAFKIIDVGATDVGLRREANEDSFLMIPKNSFWIVADGMGGHAGGQVASRITVETIGQNLVRRLHQAEQGGARPDVALLLEETIQGACARVFDTARRQPALMGMGSTVTSLLIYGDVAWIGHVGDSRAYLIRDGRIHQITEDHSLVQEQVSAGLITPEQARISPMRNIITRSIGFEREVEVSVSAVPLASGDRFILCSDGLTGHLKDDDLLRLVEDVAIRQVPERLVQRANDLGGEDNTTVVALEVQRHRQRKKHRHVS
ncbi:Stp1/IreP family PP2C-type Ser/Thr phosphatase [Myxococcota bacterium]|nr:Stp1/IreP family PP2C-type Ser/Thr phosphatase [Myxococcota bacterium]MBU1429901.1 Stp1/IreP family PP2C-type Ser/Thr phosphatase [Myxococcota bacterium]MBU1898217.1 Stp1/IreP family PP2C-type Ser/Thr phosphatase [Myxococcota bacterium]